MSSFATLEIVEMQTTDDVRATQNGQRWLNVLLRKASVADEPA